FIPSALYDLLSRALRASSEHCRWNCFGFSPYSFYRFFFYCYGGPRALHSFPTRRSSDLVAHAGGERPRLGDRPVHLPVGDDQRRDRKSTRLNSSHVAISYAVFCLKKKKKIP